MGVVNLFPLDRQIIAHLLWLTFEKIIRNRAFASQEQMLYFPYIFFKTIDIKQYFIFLIVFSKLKID